MIAVLKVALLALFDLLFLVSLALLAPQNSLDLLSDHHEGFECALQAGGDLLEEAICGEKIWLLRGLLLKELFPGLVGRHEEPQRNCFQCVLWRLRNRLLRTAPKFDGLLLHADCKLGKESRTEGGGLGLGEALTVDWGVVLQPKFHQVQKDLVVVDERPVEMACLIFPLVSQLAADFLEEDGEFVEFVLGLLLAEQVKAGVVVDVVLLGVVA